MDSSNLHHEVAEGGSLGPVVAPRRKARAVARKKQGMIRETISKRDGLPRYEVIYKAKGHKFYQGGIATQDEAESILERVVKEAGKPQVNGKGKLPLALRLASFDGDEIAADCLF